MAFNVKFCTRESFPQDHLSNHTLYLVEHIPGRAKFFFIFAHIELKIYRAKNKEYKTNSNKNKNVDVFFYMSKVLLYYEF